jgi:transposase-like protein
VETIGRIRRERLLKGKSIKEIARDLKVSRNTVRKVLRSGATAFEYEREVQPRPKLVRMERPAPDLQHRGLRCESGETAAQSRMQMGAGNEKRTICGA